MSHQSATTATPGRDARYLHLGGPIPLRMHRRALATCLVMAVVSVVLVCVALMLGEQNFTPAEVANILAGNGSRTENLFVLTWRLPRALAAIVVGALLGASGALFQTLTRNPLGSPDIIGFTTGAQTGGLLAILLVGSSFFHVTVGAMLGGFATAAVVMTLARRGAVQGFRLIIVGIAITAMLTSIDTWLILTADLDIAMIAAVWGVGSLNGTAWAYATPALIGGAVALLATSLLGRSVAQLDLGDDNAKALGARPDRTRVLAILVGVLLVALATTLAGPVAFVALAAPQIGRRIAGAHGTPLAPAAFTGAALMLLADLLAQHALPGTALPVGLVTVILGGAYLLHLIASEARKGSL